MKKLFGRHLVILVVCLCLQVLTGSAQILDPVHVTPSSKSLGNGEYELVFPAKIDEGWHLYSQFIEDGGPIPSSINFEEPKGYEKLGKPTEIGTRVENYEPLFEMNLIWFEKSATFKQKIRVTAPSATVKGYFEYITCNDRSCLPPAQVEFSFNLKGAESKAEQPDTVSKSAITPDTAENSSAVITGRSRGFHRGKMDSSTAAVSTANPGAAQNEEFEKRSWWSIFLIGFRSRTFLTDHTLRLLDDTTHCYVFHEEKRQ
jgi:thiol:disulfide interchange protein DsbD